MSVSYALLERIYGAEIATTQRNKDEARQASWEACFDGDYDPKFTHQQRTPDVKPEIISELGAKAIRFDHRDYWNVPELPPDERMLIKPYGVWGLVAPCPQARKQF